MQVLFKSRHPQATDLRDMTERRVRFVLRRLGWLVPRAEVQMSDLNGPRGGIDKRCQVELRTDGAGSVVVASVASDWHAALNQALAKAVRFLLRALRRGAATGRVRQRGGAVPVDALLGDVGPSTSAAPIGKPGARPAGPDSADRIREPTRGVQCSRCLD